MRQVVSRIYADKLPKATDTDLILVLQVLRDEAAAVDQTDPALCVAMLSPQGTDISSSLPSALAKRDEEMMAQVISDDGVTIGKAVSPADLQSFIVKSIQIISKTLDLPVSQVIAAFQGKGPDDLKCKLSTGLFSEVLNLPVGVQGPMIRILLFAK